MRDNEALKAWLRNPGSNEEWNQDDVDWCHAALMEIVCLEAELASCRPNAYWRRFARHWKYKILALFRPTLRWQNYWRYWLKIGPDRQ